MHFDLVVVVIACLNVLHIQSAVLVKTKNGIVRGFNQRVHLNDAFNCCSVHELFVFRSIPYAKPPIGPNRFKRPSAFSWLGVKDTNTIPNSCPQLPDYSFNRSFGVDEWNVPNQSRLSEDCLYLSIWAPIKCVNCAVLVWIYGGFFTSGSIALDIYDAGPLAAYENIIVVTVNYRLGALGFMYDKSVHSANFGLLDQQLALKWVYENIVNFGGNNAFICLAGESAGAISVDFHLNNRISRRYFTHAILQSGTSKMSQAVNNIETAKLKTIQLATKLKCYDKVEVDMECLRTTKVDDILQATLSIDCDPLTKQYK